MLSFVHVENTHGLYIINKVTYALELRLLRYNNFSNGFKNIIIKIKKNILKLYNALIMNNVEKMLLLSKHFQIFLYEDLRH